MLFDEGFNNKELRDDLAHLISLNDQARLMVHDGLREMVRDNPKAVCYLGQILTDSDTLSHLEEVPGWALETVWTLAMTQFFQCVEALTAEKTEEKTEEVEDGE